MAAPDPEDRDIRVSDGGHGEETVPEDEEPEEAE